jgi:hypothetical protein
MLEIWIFASLTAQHVDFRSCAGSLAGRSAEAARETSANNEDDWTSF